jgi:hypothetical protein
MGGNRLFVNDDDDDDDVHDDRHELTANCRVRKRSCKGQNIQDYNFACGFIWV